MQRNLARLSPEQLVGEIRQAKADIEATARYLGQAAMLLHAQARRSDFREEAGRRMVVPEGTPREVAERLRRDAGVETSGVYTLYANTWQRFAGMVLQGTRRTASSDKILRRLDGRQSVVGEGGGAPPPPSPVSAPTNDLMELYGVETVTHAQR